MWEKHTTDTGQSFGKDLGAARSRLGSAHDVMPRVVVVVIVIVVVVVSAVGVLCHPLFVRSFVRRRADPGTKPGVTRKRRRGVR